jgi:arginine exporter protein ArgO
MGLFYTFPKKKKLFQLQLVHLSKMSKTNIEKETNLKHNAQIFLIFISFHSHSQQPNTQKKKTQMQHKKLAKILTTTALRTCTFNPKTLNQASKANTKRVKCYRLKSRHKER